ncbi:uncharacterized protein F4807DRAFT_434040 [Annulohypoxylon truncatum]|uniref:uncharacterized protein n=1 Tax=Annulohypoxylon truncatum TaxID=327061 RepID=UPI0020072945|nr:uncharacterized protein F4807DRAFT_434040 [Annulohypoxylon truncatum]KAI1207651.1 hypothetical protein F4807DRAFT_434040 [Annulohypoxylon truncatum]
MDNSRFQQCHQNADILDNKRQDTLAQQTRELMENVFQIKIILATDHHVIPQGPCLLRKLYEDAKETKYEYASTALWIKILSSAFYESAIFSLSCEFPPDNSLRRVDIVLNRYNESGNYQTGVLYCEAKKVDGSEADVTKQIRDAARRSSEHHGLAGVYTLAVIGTKFDMQYYDKAPDSFYPLTHGYADIDSEACREFLNTVHLIKGDTPLRQAPTVPSNA